MDCSASLAYKLHPVRFITINLVFMCSICTMQCYDGSLHFKRNTYTTYIDLIQGKSKTSSCSSWLHNLMEINLTLKVSVYTVVFEMYTFLSTAWWWFFIHFICLTLSFCKKTLGQQKLKFIYEFRLFSASYKYGNDNDR